MGDMIDAFRDMRTYRWAMRRRWGVTCPSCAKVRPRSDPSILLPQQRCRVDGYVDPRPELTDEQIKEALEAVK